MHISKHWSAVKSIRISEHFKPLEWALEWGATLLYLLDWFAFRKYWRIKDKLLVERTLFHLLLRTIFKCLGIQNTFNRHSDIWKKTIILRIPLQILIYITCWMKCLQLFKKTFISGGKFEFIFLVGNFS